MANVHNFPRTVRDHQIRVNSLFLLKTPLTVDGMNGPNTRKGIQEAMEFFDTDLREEIFHPSGITRAHWHWSASSYQVSTYTRKHYNDVFDEKGNHYDGASPAQQQAFYIPGRVGVSHTRMANTGAIGLSVACMHGASTRGSTVDAGQSPITWAGIDGMLQRTAEYMRMFDIRNSPWTTLSHAEIQSNIGIRQNGKWDIRVLPSDLRKLLTARDVGDQLRERLQDFQG